MAVGVHEVGGSGLARQGNGRQRHRPAALAQRHLLGAHFTGAHIGHQAKNLGPHQGEDWPGVAAVGLAGHGGGGAGRWRGLGLHGLLPAGGSVSPLAPTLATLSNAQPGDKGRKKSWGLSCCRLTPNSGGRGNTGPPQVWAKADRAGLRAGHGQPRGSGAALGGASRAQNWKSPGRFRWAADATGPWIAPWPWGESAPDQTSRADHPHL